MRLRREDVSDFIQIKIKLRNDLTLALDLAHTNYRILSKKISWWSKLLGGNKNLSLISLKNK